MTELTLLACFITGLVSTLHCWGMCGGISTMLLSHNNTTISHHRSLLPALAYNSGRIFSYSMIGLIAGTLSEFSTRVFFLDNGFIVLQLLSSVILILIALKILGRFVLLDFIEKQMRIIWVPLQNILGFLLPAQTPFQQFCVGMIWGWVPCGMVYSVLLLTLTSGKAIDSMLYMLLFGLGTLPGMMSLYLGAESFFSFLNKKRFRYLSAMVIFFIALWQPIHWMFKPSVDHQHHHHHSIWQNLMHPNHHIGQSVLST